MGGGGGDTLFTGPGYTVTRYHRLYTPYKVYIIYASVTVNNVSP